MYRPAAILATITLVGAAAIPATANPGDSPARQHIAWQDCSGNNSPSVAQCATLTVPVDWNHPQNQSLSLAISRLQTHDPEQRIGTLVLMPGGPGQSGLEWVSNAEEQLSSQLRNRFDIVSFDPRGIGASTPLDCTIDLSGPKPVPTSQNDLDIYLNRQRAAWEECRRHDPLVDHLDHISVAKDVEAIRLALGEETLTLYGISYGTLTEQTYAELFPGRVRAMLLESVVDHTRPWAQKVTMEAGNIEAIFTEFARQLSTDPASAFYDRDALQTLTDMVHAAEVDPIPAPRSKYPEESVTGQDLQNVMSAVSHWPPAMWPKFSQDLAAAAAGDASAIRDFLGSANSNDPFPWGSTTAITAMICGDWTPASTDYLGLNALIDQANQAAPHLLPSGIAEFMMCMDFNRPAANPPHPLVFTTVPPTLVVNPSHDHMTPHEGARRVSEQIPGSVLLTIDGIGHSVAMYGPCRTYLDDFLIDQRLPAPDTHCPMRAT